MPSIKPGMTNSYLTAKTFSSAAASVGPWPAIVSRLMRAVAPD